MNDSTKYEETPLIPTEITAETNHIDNNKRYSIKNIIKLIVIIAIVISLIFLITSKLLYSQQNAYDQSQKQALLEQNIYLDIEPITVALAQSGARKEYLRLEVSLRLNSEQESSIILQRMPIIKDTLITFLVTLRPDDFYKSSNLLYLKEEIIKRINKISAPITVKEVLFQEITVN